MEGEEEEEAAPEVEEQEEAVGCRRLHGLDALHLPHLEVVFPVAALLHAASLTSLVLLPVMEYSLPLSAVSPDHDLSSSLTSSRVWFCRC